MLYDFHIHTRNYSHCSSSTADEMCQAALERGLTGIGLTEHDVWWPAEEIDRLQAHFPTLVIMRGIEHSSPDGHFLLYLPEPERAEIPSYCPARVLIPAVHDLGGIAIWAHPFRWEQDIPIWIKEARPDGMEVASSNMDRVVQDIAMGFAVKHNIMMFQDSDAHHHKTIGAFANDFPESFSGVADFIRYVREKNKELVK